LACSCKALAAAGRITPRMRRPMELPGGASGRIVPWRYQEPGKDLTTRLRTNFIFKLPRHVAISTT
jgi:hypothetical protein